MRVAAKRLRKRDDVGCILMARPGELRVMVWSGKWVVREYEVVLYVLT